MESNSSGISIQLVPLDVARLEALLRDLDGGLRVIVSNGPAITGFLLPALQQGRDFHRRVASDPPWHGYLAVDAEDRRLAGICGFKGNPTPGGDVEIAYGTAPGLESRGYATQMAKALLEIAFGSSAVQRVIAHTLPEANASTRVLQKAGLNFSGEVMDPEDGRVWRWETARPGSA
jgi:RimJ/RimL family protein N-acetyltransferase